MDLTICYICNLKADEWQNNLSELKSQHSRSPIKFFINKFLGGFESSRNVDDESNSICMGCLQRIDEYDLSCVIAEQTEKELQELLLKTEHFYVEEQKKIHEIEELNVDCEPRDIQTKPMNDDSDEAKTDSDDGDVDNAESDSDFKCEIKSESSEDEGDDLEFVPAGKSEMGKDVFIQVQKKRLGEKALSKLTKLSEEGTYRVRTGRRGRPADQPHYECSDCPMRFRIKRDLILHERWHRKQKIPEFRCGICFYELDDKESFDDHMKRHTSRGALECVLCEAKFSKKGGLQKHARGHNNRPTHMCELCGRMFAHAGLLDTHMKFHLKVKTKKCPDCAKMFTTSSHLNRHMQVHRNDKPFQCHLCPNRFGYKYNLQAHMQLHTKTDKTHLCSFCGAAYARKSKLSEHLQKNHATAAPHSTIENQLQSHNVNESDQQFPSQSESHLS